MGGQRAQDAGGASVSAGGAWIVRVRQRYDLVFGWFTFHVFNPVP
jgi:hypothetical protein